MNNYLFLFTISPVQSFISQARKTQDLFAGSKLLTNLIDSTIKELKETGENVEIIFPYYDDNETDKNYPNRFVTKIENIDKEDIEKISNQLETKVKARFKEIADKRFNQNVNKNKAKPNSFDNQIDSLLSVYWVAEEYSDNYKESYDKLEQFLGSIKNVRKFNQLGETGRKCSLCGERNLIICQKNDKNNLQIKPNRNEIKGASAETEINNYNNSIVEIESNRFTKKEGLCAVCFTKRFYKKHQTFPSTAEIATLKVINKQNTKKMKNLFKSKFDYQLFYEENLNKNYFRKQGLPFKKLEKAKQIQNEIVNNLKEGKNLNKYYALIMSDGDNMGNWLSGQYLKDQTKLEYFHNKFSERLGVFTSKARDYLNDKKRGETVYAGGDDFLGFVNLESLFDFLKKLRKLFDSKVNSQLKNKFKFKKEQEDITLSAGVVIAHYKTPLHIVLDWARKMEHIAKEEAGRDAFAMAVLKHSGEIHQTYWKWNCNQKTRIELIKNIISNIQSEKFSTSFISNIQEEFNKLKDNSGNLNNYKMMFETELKRLVGRSCNLSKKEGKEKESNSLMEIFENFTIESGDNIDNFFSLLNIIRFLLKESNHLEVKQ